MRLSESEYQDLINRRKYRQASLNHKAVIESYAAPKVQKYRNQKIEIDGITFSSKKEGARFQQLKMLEIVGKVSGLSLQPSFELAPTVTLHGRNKPALRYCADFSYFEDGVYVVEDVKSEITKKDPVYRIKIHLMKSVLNIDVRET